MKRKPRVPTKPARVQKFIVNALRRYELARKADAKGPPRIRSIAPIGRLDQQTRALFALRLNGAEEHRRFLRLINPVMPSRATRWRRKLEAAGASR